MHRKLVALFDFWGTYIGKTEDSILFTSFEKMLSLYEFFSEFSSLHLERETFVFVYNTIEHIFKMEILDFNGSVDDLRRKILRFLETVKNQLPVMTLTTV